MENVPSLADFRSPPIVEVVRGVQFFPIPGFNTVHIGLFWERLKAAFPTVRDLPPLPTVIESLGAGPQQSVMIGFGSPQVPRVQFADDTSGQFLQIQSGRFLHNWQKRQPADEYLRYKNLQPVFLQRWSEFRAFVAALSLPPVQLNQYELSYINHIFPGDLWDESRGLRDILPWFAPTSSATGSGFEPEFALHSAVPRCNGRLHVTGKVGLRASDRTRVFQFELTVRGGPGDAQGGDLSGWLDAAHEVIVRSFVDLTSDRAREQWGQVR